MVKLPNWMGDILFSYDLLFTLSKHFDRVGLCTSTSHAELFRAFPIPRTELILYSPADWPWLDRDTILKLEAFRADAGLLLPNSLGSALVFRFAGISHLYGYSTEHRGFLLEESLPKPVQRLHQRDYYLKLLALLDLAPEPYPALAGNRGRTVVIHAGASKPPRAWHLDRYLKVGEALQNMGYDVVLVTQDPLTDGPLPRLVSPTLLQFTDLLKHAALFIGNDSGPLHLAQQCGCPVVGIYGPGDPMVTGPRSLSPGRTVYSAFPCSPCRQRFFRDCKPSQSGKPFCIEVLTVDQVLKAATDILSLQPHASGVHMA